MNRYFQAEKLSAQDSRLVMDKKKYFKSPQLHVQRSNVTRLKMPLELKTTAISLQDRVIATNIKVQESRNALRKSQNNVEGRTDDKPFEQMDTIVVQNLVHKGSSSIFKGNFKLISLRNNIFTRFLFQIYC